MDTLRSPQSADKIGMKGSLTIAPFPIAVLVVLMGVFHAWADELTLEERNWLAAHRSLRVGVAPAWAPFEFFDDDQTHAGITSDYVRILNEHLNLEMAAVYGLTWDVILNKARNGDIDVITAIMNTEERSEYLSFTEPYLRLPTVIVARKDFPHIEGLKDLKGKSVAVVKGYVTQYWIERDLPGQGTDAGRSHG